jgi:hypothetical protein
MDLKPASQYRGQQQIKATETFWISPSMMESNRQFALLVGCI